MSTVSTMVSKTTSLGSNPSTPAIFLFFGGIMDTLKNIAKKVLNREVIFYTIFGILSTLVNFITFYILTKISVEENLANFIAIIMAVLFAYFTNRKIVFNSKAETFKEKLKEFYKFILGRVFTMFVEMFGFYLLFNIMSIHEIISKLVITIIVVILNFFISKFFAFKKQNK